MQSIILASSSPRRSEILSNLNIPFKTIVSFIDESQFTASNPIELVKILAFEKAHSILSHTKKGDIIVGADTIVVYNGKILGKPKDIDEAYEFLKLLSNNYHYVYTGIAILDNTNQKEFIDYGLTKVYMRNYSDGDIYAYIKTKEPLDKAGAYAIQGYGSVLVEKIEGDYFNVVGLPVSKLIEGFLNLNINYFNTFHN